MLQTRLKDASLYGIVTNFGNFLQHVADLLAVGERLAVGELARCRHHRLGLQVAALQTFLSLICQAFCNRQVRIFGTSHVIHQYVSATFMCIFRQAKLQKGSSFKVTRLRYDKNYYVHFINVYLFETDVSKM